MAHGRVLGKECLLKQLENKSGIAAWAKDTGSEGEVKERVQAYQKETATQEGRDLGTTAETEH